MPETTSSAMEAMRGRQAATAAAHDAANREALLAHARLGQSVCESRDGQVVWISPAEVFARYGLNEFGRPKES
jgi:hypothetical protein